MNTTLTAHQFDLNDSLHDYVDDKLTASIKPLIDDSATQLEVTLSLQDNSQEDEKATCVVNLVIPRLPPIVVKKSGPTIYAAIDAVHNTLHEQVSNAVGRRLDLHHRRREAAKHRDEVARQGLTAALDGPIVMDDTRE
jgi:ribosome-associated translation inhibitor RaiA